MIFLLYKKHKWIYGFYLFVFLKIKKSLSIIQVSAGPAFSFEAITIFTDWSVGWVQWFQIVFI